MAYGRSSVMPMRPTANTIETWQRLKKGENV